MKLSGWSELIKHLFQCVLLPQAEEITHTVLYQKQRQKVLLWFILYLLFVQWQTPRFCCGLKAFRMYECILWLKSITWMKDLLCHIYNFWVIPHRSVRRCLPGRCVPITVHLMNAACVLESVCWSPKIKSVSMLGSLSPTEHNDTEIPVALYKD